MNGRKAKQARRVAADLREAGFAPPRRARRLRPWLERRYGMQARPTLPAGRWPSGPPLVAEYQSLRKVTGRRGLTQPGRARAADARGEGRQYRQTRRAAWRARQQRRRIRRQQREAA